MVYRFLEHTADIKFVAEGKTLEEAFVASAEALKDSICGQIVVMEQQTKKLEVEGNNLENLLYNFLEEFLVLFDSEDFLLSKISDIKIDQEKFKLTATVSGDKTENYKFTNDVKAVTYSEMKVEFDESKPLWKIQAVLDV